jgi:hypothetical protein
MPLCSRYAACSKFSIPRLLKYIKQHLIIITEITSSDARVKWSVDV